MTVENLKTIIDLVFIQVISGWKWILPGLLDKKTEDEGAAKEKRREDFLQMEIWSRELASQISSYIWPSVFFLQFSISPSLSSVEDMLRTSLQDELIHYFPINRLRWIEHLDSLFKMLVDLSTCKFCAVRREEAVKLVERSLDDIIMSFCDTEQKTQ